MVIVMDSVPLDIGGGQVMDVDIDAKEGTHAMAIGRMFGMLVVMMMNIRDVMLISFTFAPRQVPSPSPPRPPMPPLSPAEWSWELPDSDSFPASSE